VVPNATEFCADAIAQSAFKKALAQQANVSIPDVNTSCEVVSIASSSSRRLQTEAAEMSYAITLSGDDQATVESQGNQMIAQMKLIKNEELALLVQQVIVADGGKSYIIEVRSFVPEETFTVKVWPSTTATPPTPSPTPPPSPNSTTTTLVLDDGEAQDGSIQLSTISFSVLVAIVLLSQ